MLAKTLIEINLIAHGTFLQGGREGYESARKALPERQLRTRKQIRTEYELQQLEAKIAFENMLNSCPVEGEDG